VKPKSPHRQQHTEEPPAVKISSRSGRREALQRLIAIHQAWVRTRNLRQLEEGYRQKAHALRGQHSPEAVRVRSQLASVSLNRRIEQNIADALLRQNSDTLEVLATAQEECRAAWDRTDPSVFDEKLGNFGALLVQNLDRCGFLLFISTDGMAVNDLLWPWATLWEHAAFGNQTARTLYHRTLSAMRIGPGAPVTLTAGQKEKSARDLEAQHDLRARKYCKQALTRWQERTKKLPPEELSTRRLVATAVAGESLIRGGKAKKEGVRRFLQQVEQELSSPQARTVRKNSR
jgi:hypothetical protein